MGQKETQIVFQLTKMVMLAPCCRLSAESTQRTAKSI